MNRKSVAASCSLFDGVNHQFRLVDVKRVRESIYSGFCMPPVGVYVYESAIFSTSSLTLSYLLLMVRQRTPEIGWNFERTKDLWYDKINKHLIYYGFWCRLGSPAAWLLGSWKADSANICKVFTISMNAIFLVRCLDGSCFLSRFPHRPESASGIKRVQHTFRGTLMHKSADSVAIQQ